MLNKCYTGRYQGLVRGKISTKIGKKQLKEYWTKPNIILKWSILKTFSTRNAIRSGSILPEMITTGFWTIAKKINPHTTTQI